MGGCHRTALMAKRFHALPGSLGLLRLEPRALTVLAFTPISSRAWNKSTKRRAPRESRLQAWTLGNGQGWLFDE